MAEIESKMPMATTVFDGAGADDAKDADSASLVRDPIAALIHAATDLAAPPRYSSTTPVACIFGDPLGRILWQGTQWAVTVYGLQCRDGGYSITRFRLWENEGQQGGWIRHMARKPWVDVQDFAEALRIARGKHARHEGER
jgi:hypothetical protein